MSSTATHRGASRPQILYIARRVPARDASNAGSKVFAYYLGVVAEWADCDVIALGQASDRHRQAPAVRRVDVVLLAAGGDLLSLSGFIARLRAYFELRSLLLKRRRHRYDLVVLEWSFSSVFAPLVHRLWNVPVIITVHDLVWDQLASRIRKGSKLNYALRRAAVKLIAWIERRLYNRANYIVTFSERDRWLMRRMGVAPPISVISPYYGTWSSAAEKLPGSLCFYGDMSRRANWYSVCWFIQQVMPRLQAEGIDVVFYVVGGSPPPELAALSDGIRVVVTGWLDDPAELLGKMEVFVAPLKEGAGIKIKILEAMASGLPVIATSIAMEGIGAEPGIHYLHAETEEDFVRQIRLCLSDPRLRQSLAARGMEHVRRRFDPATSAVLLQRIYREAIASR